MPEVVGIRFKPCGKIYDFESTGLELKEGDSVVVESDFGVSVGTVAKGTRLVESPQRELKKIIRLTNEEDRKTIEGNKKLESEAKEFCNERIMARGLPMKLVGVESTLDRKRIVFFFTADGRIDFRELVKDLAAKFKTRIEMRQIGVRDEAKLVGGIGLCGRNFCCVSFLSSFEPVSIKMAKRQELALNVGKLSGTCGRLMCCLRYEYEGDLSSITSDEEIPLDADVPIEALAEKGKNHVPRQTREAEPAEKPAQQERSSAEVQAQPERKKKHWHHKRRRHQQK